MLTTPQLKAFYLDLQDERMESALGIVHSRFSTNTFPSWPLAHPFRRVAHNGEINTVNGTKTGCVPARLLISRRTSSAPSATSTRFAGSSPGAGHRPVRRGSRTAASGGRSLAHSVLMMIPEAWERHESMDPPDALYAYHSSLMETVDGPASVCFSDGTVVGAVRPKRLRPSRIW